MCPVQRHPRRPHCPGRRRQCRVRLRSSRNFVLGSEFTKCVPTAGSSDTCPAVNGPNNSQQPFNYYGTVSAIVQRSTLILPVHFLCRRYGVVPSDAQDASSRACRRPPPRPLLSPAILPSSSPFPPRSFFHGHCRSSLCALISRRLSLLALIRLPEMHRPRCRRNLMIQRYRAYERSQTAAGRLAARRERRRSSSSTACLHECSSSAVRPRLIATRRATVTRIMSVS